MNFSWDHKSFCHPPKNLVFDVFKKIEAEKHIDLLLILLKTNHNTDLKRFMSGNSYFKSYIKMVAAFDSRVYFPGDRPSRFMMNNHSWYALRILKHDALYKFKISDIFYLN